MDGVLENEKKVFHLNLFPCEEAESDHMMPFWVLEAPLTDEAEISNRKMLRNSHLSNGEPK
jgi:hypothetical protein